MTADCKSDSEPIPPWIYSRFSEYKTILIFYALEGPMSLRPSVLANIVMEECCNTAEQQLGESADLYS